MLFESSPLLINQFNLNEPRHEKICLLILSFRPGKAHTFAQPFRLARGLKLDIFSSVLTTSESCMRANHCFVF